MPIYTFRHKETEVVHQVIAASPAAGRQMLAKEHKLKPSQLQREYMKPPGVIFKNNLGNGRGTTRKSTFRKPE